ncbi:MAG: hypothetical protein M0Z59_03120 [Nitrospiraceae bacterium]|nr:hypothetical protein [Nitrospiraceae bacterium]
MPETKSLHVDAILSEMSVKYRNEAMIWPLLMPVVKVQKRSDKFFVYQKEDSYRLADDAVAPKGLPNEITWGVLEDNYSVVDHALGDWLPQEVIDNADGPIQPEADTVDFLNMLLDVRQEKRVADIVFSQATYPAGNQTALSGTAQWGGTTDDPVGDVMNAVEGCFIRANTLVFGAEAWAAFRKLPEVLEAVKSVNTGANGFATAGEVAALFEVEHVLVGRARYITSKEGQPSAYTRLWGKHCAALYTASNPGLRSITFGLTFSEMAREVQRDFDPKRGVKGAHYIKAAWNSDEKAVAPELGCLIRNAVA